MKLQTAITKLEKAGFEVEEVMEDRNYMARQEGKSTIEISADSTGLVYFVAYVAENQIDDTIDYQEISLTRTIVRNLTQAIKFA